MAFQIYQKIVSKIRYDYDANGNCIYVGMTMAKDASEDKPIWKIYRYDYDANGNCINKRFQVTSYTNRTLGW